MYVVLANLRVHSMTSVRIDEMVHLAAASLKDATSLLVQKAKL